MRRLIINADDFGLTAGVNRAIVEAHSGGIVTSATMMANAGGFDDGVRQAQSSPTLSVGCHVVLVDGAPVLPAEKIPDLLEPGTQHFHRSLATFAALVLRNRIRPEQIEAEARAQIGKLQAAGIRVSHLDTHKHTHMLPQVSRPLLRAARACGISAIRNPFEPVRLSLLGRGPKVWKRWIEVKALRSLQRRFVEGAKEAGITTIAGTLGIVVTGILDQQLFKAVVNEIPDGTWELVCHPGYNDADLQGVATRLRESRVRELQVLTAPESREWLEKAGFQLISYRDLG